MYPISTPKQYTVDDSIYWKILVKEYIAFQNFYYISLAGITVVESNCEQINCM